MTSYKDPIKKHPAVHKVSLRAPSRGSEQQKLYKERKALSCLQPLQRDEPLRDHKNIHKEGEEEREGGKKEGVYRSKRFKVAHAKETRDTLLFFSGTPGETRTLSSNS